MTTAQFLLATSVFFASHSLASDYADIIFTEEAARTNTLEFISLLQSEVELTLKHYSRYDDFKTEHEAGQKLLYCYEKWGPPYSCTDGNKVPSWEPNCMAYYDRIRSLAPDKSPSIYLNKLRGLFTQSDKSIIIRSVELTTRADLFSDYYFQIGVGKDDFLIRHAASQISYDLGGKVTVLESNGIAVKEIIPGYDGKESNCENR